jgi:hypothetical protein
MEEFVKNFDYILIDIIGKGNCGVVFLVLNKKTNEQ